MLHRRMLSPLRYNVVKKFKGLHKRLYLAKILFFAVNAALVCYDFGDIYAQYMYSTHEMRIISESRAWDKQCQGLRFDSQRVFHNDKMHALNKTETPLSKSQNLNKVQINCS